MSAGGSGTAIGRAARAAQPREAARTREGERAHAIRVQLRCVVVAANLLGAIDCFLLVTWILPTPPVHDRSTLVLEGTVAFVVYMALSIATGAVQTRRLLAPLEHWLSPDVELSPGERRAILHLPLRQTTLSAAAWVAAIFVFAAIAAGASGALARYTAITIAIGGITTCSLVYLLAERVLRPVTAQALTGASGRRPVAAGIKGRLVLAWATATGTSLLGLALVGVDAATRTDLTKGRIAVSVLVLAGLGLFVGLYATVIAARSVADPVRSVRDALARVEQGDLEVAVPVYDGSEIGLLQSGFNQMAAGLRERERLRDLFGRHVGEDVARAALEGDDALGGDVREVAVLFVDLIGSTTIAARRPPTEVVTMLNRFFAAVVEVVGGHGGWVNKFEGDGALCVFGAPGELGDAAGAALAAARELHGRLERELPDADAAIGVSAGPVVAGNVGAERRFEYTVIGDAVNEAARLCERAKGEPGRVLASDAAMQRAGSEETDFWTEGERVELRGRATPTRIARPVGT